ncbi:hypothetical protein [Acinetobacter sp. TSRC1-2]|uniref:hypothetical protein n=1 Tax=unclassified Acinetobacter TaxID=196816 RepID=UPI003CF8E1AE
MHSLSLSVSVAGQMATEKFRTLFDPGFKSVIVNRPDQKQGNLVSDIHYAILPNKLMLVLFTNRLPVLKFLKQT